MFQPVATPAAKSNASNTATLQGNLYIKYNTFNKRIDFTYNWGDTYHTCIFQVHTRTLPALHI